VRVIELRKVRVMVGQGEEERGEKMKFIL